VVRSSPTTFGEELRAGRERRELPRFGYAHGFVVQLMLASAWLTSARFDHPVDHPSSETERDGPRHPEMLTLQNA
jgi:hypothetical protein